MGEYSSFHLSGAQVILLLGIVYFARIYYKRKRVKEGSMRCRQTTGTKISGLFRATQRPARFIVAVPMSASQTCQALQPEADKMICTITLEPFHNVSHWSENFSQVTEEEVRILSQEANQKLLYG